MKSEKPLEISTTVTSQHEKYDLRTFFSSGTCGVRRCIFFECSAGEHDPTPAPVCKDENTSCPKYESHCHSVQVTVKEYMKQNCKKTCNLCEPSGKPKQTSCDVSKVFGKLEGDHILKLNSDGEY